MPQRCHASASKKDPVMIHQEFIIVATLVKVGLLGFNFLKLKLITDEVESIKKTKTQVS